MAQVDLYDDNWGPPRTHETTYYDPTPTQTPRPAQPSRGSDGWQTWDAQPRPTNTPTAPTGAAPTIDPRIVDAIQNRIPWPTRRKTPPTQLPAATPPAPAPSPSRASGQPFRAWWEDLIRDKPVNQQTLLDLEEILRQSGSQLTTPNSIGERTKIWDPDLQDWVRVGFGEGTWQYIPQGWGASGPSAAAAPAGGSRWSDEATKAMEAYIKERIERLKQPAYTGAEWETFRTAALDPIEGDRQASRQRALQNIGARGLDPTSGIAQELLNQVDAGFDQSRAKTQNQLAYNRVNEQRSREQEAQALLTILHELPNQSLQQALAALGMGPNPQSLSNQYMQYWQGQQANSLPWWQMLGSLLPHLFPGSR